MACNRSTVACIVFIAHLILSLVHAHSGHHRRLGQLHQNLHLRTLDLDKRTVTPVYTPSSNPGEQNPGNYDSFVHGSQTTNPAPASSAPVSLSTTKIDCPDSNGTTLTTLRENYVILCDVDFAGQNLQPFLKATSFESCLSFCDEYNNKTEEEETCIGIVLVPSRSGAGYADDCYLKSALSGAFAASTSLIAAIPAASSVNASSGLFGSSAPASSTASLKSSLTPFSSVKVTGSSTTYASATAIVSPSVKGHALLGASQNKPTMQYVNHSSSKPITLASDLLGSKENTDLIENYPIATDTGCMAESASYELAPLSQTPILSRDGGKGGYLNGQNLFIFCDTTTYAAANATHDGEFLGMVSSSVAIDEGLNALNGQALTLQDGLGQWSDDVGRLRGFAPMTTGEEGYNYVMSGNGYRYAIWPGSSLIPLNATSGLIYANIIYDVVDMTTQAAAFKNMGNTLVMVTTDNWGPIGTRLVKQMFTQDEVNWGSLGGLRSWGSSGPGGNDGRIYVFSAATNGILTGRVDAQDFADKSKYEYWDGEVWSSSMPSNSSAACLIMEQIMDFDIFYSPHFLTMIMIYLTKDADNTFYYRYLNSSKPVIPEYAGGNSSMDYVEQVANEPWSEPSVLYKADTPPAGNFIYDGSFHAGYFGENDVINGGDKMLLSWTQHTGQDGGSAQTGYAHMTVVLTLE